MMLPGMIYAQNLPGDSLTTGKTKSFKAELSTQLGGTSNNRVPFWMRSNQFGSIPEKGVSGALIGSVKRDYNPGNKKIADWGMSLNLRANIGSKVELIPVEAYVKGKLGIFEIKGGRSRDISGLVDTTLSSGSFAVSGNALGIPKVQFGIPEFWSLPFTKDLIAIKGSMSVGWMGKTGIQTGENSGAMVPTYFHDKSIHARLGKPNGRVKAFFGINHEVMWGSDRFIFGNEYDLSHIEAFYYVFTGKKYAPSNGYSGRREISKIGNHLGAVDLGLELNTNRVKIFAYRQQFYDKGALYYLANILDGLNGLSISNRKPSDAAITWKKFLFEVFYSKNQAGEENAKETPSGPEHYYNHGVYSDGYSYRGLGIGTPFITTAKDARAGQASAPDNYFINNRVIAFHFGMENRVHGWDVLTKLSYSKNYGEYKTSDVKHFWYVGKLRDRIPVYGIFKKVNQFSGYVDAGKSLKHGLRLNLTAAWDQGQLLYNSFGGFVKLTKTW